MKARTIVNTLIIGSMFLIFYSIAGHVYVSFYFGGKTEILEAAERINKLCNANGSCPRTIEGWRAPISGPVTLEKDYMFYYIDSGAGSKDSEENTDHDAFSLIYYFTAPDHWFEVQGGVGKTVTSGWESRP